MEDLLFNCANWPYWACISAGAWILYIIADHYASKTGSVQKRRSCREFCTGECGVHCDFRPQEELA